MAIGATLPPDIGGLLGLSHLGDLFMSQTPSESEPRRGGALSGLWTVLRVFLRIVGTLVAVACAVAAKMLARQNPGAALGVFAVAVLVLGLGWGASRLFRWVARDAAAPRPSPAVAIFKLLLGMAVFALFFVGVQADLHVGYRNDGFPIDMLRLGVLPTAPFGGWTPMVYGLAAGIGGFGILAGLLGLMGRRATWLMRLAVLAVMAIAASAAPSLCRVRMMNLPMVHGDNHANALAFSPDGTRLAVASRGEKDSGIAVYDTTTGEEAYRCSEKEETTAVAFSPDVAVAWASVAAACAAWGIEQANATGDRAGGPGHFPESRANRRCQYLELSPVPLLIVCSPNRYLRVDFPGCR